MIQLVKLYTVTEVAKKLKRSRVLVYRWLTEGRLRGKKYGHAWLVSERDLATFKQPERRKPR